MRSEMEAQFLVVCVCLIAVIDTYAQFFGTGVGVWGEEVGGGGMFS